MLLGLFELLRSRVLVRVGSWVDRVLSPVVFRRGLDNALVGSAYRTEALRDVGTLRGFSAAAASWRCSIRPGCRSTSSSSGSAPDARGLRARRRRRAVRAGAGQPPAHPPQAGRSQCGRRQELSRRGIGVPQCRGDRRHGDGGGAGQALGRRQCPDPGAAGRRQRPRRHARRHDQVVPPDAAGGHSGARRLVCAAGAADAGRHDRGLDHPGARARPRRAGDRRLEADDGGARGLETAVGAVRQAAAAPGRHAAAPAQGASGGRERLLVAAGRARCR
jgi:hypothetical protein